MPRAFLRHAAGVLTGRHAIGASEDVGRVFFLCRDCRRVIPSWNLIQARRSEPIGCRCGGSFFVPRNISEWHAAYWVVVRGFLWRRVVQRRRDWDPRVPDRTRQPGVH